jgi:hypothetical protein
LEKLSPKLQSWEVKIADACSDFWEICMILKKISIGKRPFERPQ